MIQFQQFTVFWRPLSIEKSTFAKSCVFNQFQDPPCFFEPKIKKNTTFREKNTTVSKFFNAHRNYDDRYPVYNPQLEKMNKKRLSARSSSVVVSPCILSLEFLATPLFSPILTREGEGGGKLVRVSKSCLARYNKKTADTSRKDLDDMTL